MLFATDHVARINTSAGRIDRYNQPHISETHLSPFLSFFFCLWSCFLFHFTCGLCFLFGSECCLYNSHAAISFPCSLFAAGRDQSRSYFFTLKCPRIDLQKYFLLTITIVKLLKDKNRHISYFSVRTFTLHPVGFFRTELLRMPSVRIIHNRDKEL